MNSDFLEYPLFLDIIASILLAMIGPGRHTQYPAQAQHQGQSNVLTSCGHVAHLRCALLLAMYNLAASGRVGAVAASPVKDDELCKLDVVVGIGLAAVAKALYAY